MTETSKRIGKRGPLTKAPEDNLSEMLSVRVTPAAKHIYKSLADNFGLSETDLFYNLIAIGGFMNDIMPMVKNELDARTKPGQEEQNALWFVRFKTMCKAFSLMTDLEKERQYARGKNQKTKPQQVAEIGEFLVDYLEKKYKKV